MKVVIDSEDLKRLISREEKYLAYMEMLSYWWEDKTEVEALLWKIVELKKENKKFKADKEHTIKFNNKIIGKLKLENDKLKVIIKNNDIEQKADWKHIEELEEENKKIKADYIKLSKIVETTWGYKASYVNELRDKIAKLEKKLKTVTEGEIIIPIYDEEGKLVMKWQVWL